jgi:hypothetical protein
VRVRLQRVEPASATARVLGWFEGMQGPLMVASLLIAVVVIELLSARMILRIAGGAELITAAAMLVVAALVRGRARADGRP